MLIDGVEVECQRPDGAVAGDIARLVDFDNPDANEWLAVNQFTVVEGQHNRRPDVVVFVNGLPLAVVELENPAAEKATVWSAFNQLQTLRPLSPVRRSSTYRSAVRRSQTVPLDRSEPLPGAIEWNR